MQSEVGRLPVQPGFRPVAVRQRCPAVGSVEQQQSGRVGKNEQVTKLPVAQRTS
jgi:hypothetical protein